MANRSAAGTGTMLSPWSLGKSNLTYVMGATATGANSSVYSENRACYITCKRVERMAHSVVFLRSYIFAKYRRRFHLYLHVCTFTSQNRTKLIDYPKILIS